MNQAKDLLPLQKAIFIHFRLDFFGEDGELVAQIRYQCHIGSIITFGVHTAFVVAALEVFADVVEAGVGVVATPTFGHPFGGGECSGEFLCVVVFSEGSAGIEYGGSFGAECKGLARLLCLGSCGA